MKHLRQWHIKMRGDQEGPYSFWDLKADPRITPDTLAWKKGMPAWTPIRLIPELQELFDEGLQPPLNPGEEGVLTLEKTPKEQFLWILLIVLSLSLVLYLYMI